MKATFDSKRFRLFAQVGAIYILLTLFGDLVAHRDTFFKSAVNDLWLGVYIIAVNFVFLEYTLPAVRFSKNKILRSVAVLAGQFLLFSFGSYFWSRVGALLRVWTDFKPEPEFLDRVCSQFVNVIPSIFFFGIVIHIYDHIKLKQTAQQLRIEKQEAELNFLKSQTNPHFLFNTLNNIYSLSKDKSDLTPETILRLSKILRFMLYEASGDYIPIEREIKIINDYIALEKLRYDESLRVGFNCDVADDKQPVPPLLLIPLVENAFKHGVSETRNNPFIEINLSADQHQLNFLIKNSTEKTPDEARTVREGIGLSNLRKQLQLLYTDYELSVHQGESVFSTQLKINLASHV